MAVPPEMLSQLRFGRGLDNRKLKATGFVYRYTTRETVVKLREHMRLDPILRGTKEPYQYEREVEHFLRWSPHVRRGAGDAVAGSSEQTADSRAEGSGQVPQQAAAVEVIPVEPAAPSVPVEHYDDLEAEEVISLLGSLEVGDLEALREYEAGARQRESVIAAIEAVLARRATTSLP
jgi:UDP-glucose 4-epimerase